MPDDAPFMGGRGAEEGHGGNQDDRQDHAKKPPSDQLAPHVDVADQGLAAPERGVAEHHRVLPFKVVWIAAVLAPLCCDAPGGRPRRAGVKGEGRRDRRGPVTPETS